jgi:hypothetical protein
MAAAAARPENPPCAGSAPTMTAYLRITVGSDAESGCPAESRCRQTLHRRRLDPSLSGLRCPAGHHPHVVPRPEGFQMPLIQFSAGPADRARRKRRKLLAAAAPVLGLLVVDWFLPLPTPPAVEHQPKPAPAARLDPALRQVCEIHPPALRFQPYKVPAPSSTLSRSAGGLPPRSPPGTPATTRTTARLPGCFVPSGAVAARPRSPRPLRRTGWYPGLPCGPPALGGSRRAGRSPPGWAIWIRS